MSQHLRAAVYCRVSTDRQERDGTSLDTQLERCLERATENGEIVDPAHIIQEVASGTTWRDRRGLQTLLSLARDGEIDKVYVYALDRLSRRQVDTAVILDRFEEAGVAIESVLEPDIDNTPLGQFMRAAKAFVAESENEARVERCVRGKLARVRMGKIHNYGVDLYGYSRDKATGTRRIVEEEAAIVRRIFEWYAVDRLPIRTIVRRLNTEGVPSPAAARKKWVYGDGRVPRWGPSQIRRILTEPAYKGETVLWRYKSQGRNKNHIMRPEHEWIRLPGITPAIVAPEMWEVAQQRLRETNAATTRNERRQYLLRGLIRCAVCGLPMYSSVERGATRTYRCSSRDRPSGRCGSKRVPADIVERELWQELKAFFSDPERVRAEVARMRKEAEDAGLVAECERARQHLQRMTAHVEALAQRLAEAAGDDVLWPLLEAQVRRAEQQRRAAEAELARAERALRAHEAAIARLDDIAEACATVAANLESFTFEDRRAALEALDLRVIANGRQWIAKGGVPTSGEGVVFRSCSDSEQNARFHFVLQPDESVALALAAD